MISMIRFITGT